LALQFDPQQSHELHQYFTDLDFAFSQATIAEQAKKKRHVCRYVDVDMADLWESISQFMDQNATYDEFAKAVHALYPGLKEECKWSVVDMDKLVGEWSHLGIISLANVSDYFQHFYTITTFFWNKGQLSEAEQSRSHASNFSNTSCCNCNKAEVYILLQSFTSWQLYWQV